MKERVVQFGESPRLAGVMTEPAPVDDRDGSPCVLLLNAGIVHHVGPFRLHVDLARSLARAGFRSLRFDLSGLGDSEIRPGEWSSEERAMEDGKDAIRWLSREWKMDRFALFGLCSGAFNSHRLMLTDPRVVGSVFLDGIAFRTWKHEIRSRLRKLKPRNLRNVIQRRWQNLIHAKGEKKPGEQLAETEFFNVEQSASQISNELHSMLNRGVRMLFLFTGGHPDFSSQSQFAEMYRIQPNQGNCQVEYLPGMDHTLPIINHRKETIDRVVHWFRQTFP